MGSVISIISFLRRIFYAGDENIEGADDEPESPNPILLPKGSNRTAGHKSIDEAHKWRKFLDPKDLKHWALKHWRILLVVLLIIFLVAVIIGLALFVIKGTGMQGFHQNITTLKPEGN